MRLGVRQQLVLGATKSDQRTGVVLHPGNFTGAWGSGGQTTNQLNQGGPTLVSVVLYDDGTKADQISGAVQPPSARVFRILVLIFEAVPMSPPYLSEDLTFFSPHQI